MPSHPKSDRRVRRHESLDRIGRPAIGIESEFNVWVDDTEVVPEKYWKSPADFIQAPLLKRVGTSFQLPPGGAVYFDRGVIEVVTALVDLEPGCPARAVRNLWEQIAFVRRELDRWEGATGHELRLRAYSTHFNVSFELPVAEQNRNRNARRLAWLLAWILPVPMIVVAANRRSTGVGVRPRGNRIEVTLDFIPDPGLMIAALAITVGVIREVMSWPSYRMETLRDLPFSLIRNVRPRRHTTRFGWLTKDIHYPVSPYTSDVDDVIWECGDGRKRSLRTIALEITTFFRESIAGYSDPFTMTLLFGLLEGRERLMLQLRDRPLAYDDVGELCRWGMVLDDLLYEIAPELGRAWDPARDQNFQRFVAGRILERKHPIQRRLRKDPSRGKRVDTPADVTPERECQPRGSMRSASKRASKGRPRTSVRIDRGEVILPRERRLVSRRMPFPDRRLSRSAYERVFLNITSGRRLRSSGQTLVPVEMDGWTRAVFRRESDGRLVSLSIDDLLRRNKDWI